MIKLLFKTVPDAPPRLDFPISFTSVHTIVFESEWLQFCHDLVVGIPSPESHQIHVWHEAQVWLSTSSLLQCLLQPRVFKYPVRCFQWLVQVRVTRLQIPSDSTWLLGKAAELRQYAISELVILLFELVWLIWRSLISLILRPSCLYWVMFFVYCSEVICWCFCTIALCCPTFNILLGHWVFWDVTWACCFLKYYLAMWFSKL